jgi:hypothetical protein
MEEKEKTSEEKEVKHPEARLMILWVAGQTVIGVIMFEDAQTILVSNPRLYTQTLTPEGKVLHQLLVYFGEPSNVTINKRHIVQMYEVRDVNVRNAYIEATTGIKIAKVVPIIPKKH